jgi:hypothetical protein
MYSQNERDERPHDRHLGAFNAFWTAIALRLGEPPFGLAANGVALFAFVGVGGVIAAPIAGRLGDRGLTALATGVAHAAIVVALIAAGTSGAGWLGADPKAPPRFGAGRSCIRGFSTSTLSPTSHGPCGKVRFRHEEQRCRADDQSLSGEGNVLHHETVTSFYCG